MNDDRKALTFRESVEALAEEMNRDDGPVVPAKGEGGGA